jgi:hypothetical protein
MSDGHLELEFNNEELSSKIQLRRINTEFNTGTDKERRMGLLSKT